MKKIVNVVFTMVGVIGFASVLYGQKPAELKAVSSVSIDRYAGRWYEIAKYPNKFQKQCVGNVTATYTKKTNGKIEVLNECLKKDGTTDSAKGDAKIADKATNAKLKVRFAPGALSFLPFVWANYWIIDLDPNYQYAVIGEPDREYLWILSRKPEMNDAEYQRILRNVEAKGYAPARLQRTPQGLSAARGTVVSGL